MNHKTLSIDCADVVNVIELRAKKSGGIVNSRGMEVDDAFTHTKFRIERCFRPS